MSSVYIAINEKIEEKNKTGWFVVLAIILILYILFGILLGGD